MRQNGENSKKKNASFSGNGHARSSLLYRDIKKEEERERERVRRRRTRGVFDMNASSGAVPTRLGKRKVGRRDSLLWDLIVNNNDDICFTHILPRLNGTDLKFFYEVNEETRALIKRSSRKGELKETFKVKRCRRYRLWKSRGSIIRWWWRTCGRNMFLLSSCSNE